MNELQKEKVKKLVYYFVNLVNMSDKNIIDDLIKKLCNMNEDDCIDYIIVSLNDLVTNRQLSEVDIFMNMELITSISKKYDSKQKLMDRLEFLKSMNMMYPKMTLSENHKLVIEVFDKFNKLIGINFDAYYTGGLMGFIATNHPLERYHGDLDLLINESQLEELYELVSQSDEFEFISNMSHKEQKGHEFKIQYKGTPMSIGLFLFERKEDNEIVIKEYYYSNDELLVNENHLSSEYAKRVFVDIIRYHNNIPYRMQSLESIYNIKKNSRPKDKYDANIIKDYIDKDIELYLDTMKMNNNNVSGIHVNDSVIKKIKE